MYSNPLRREVGINIGGIGIYCLLCGCRALLPVEFHCAVRVSRQRRVFALGTLNDAVNSGFFLAGVLRANVGVELIFAHGVF
jgi:hypothetical protein